MRRPLGCTLAGLHPNLVNLTEGLWNPGDIPMVVNGHVGKVFSRCGFLSQVLVESRDKFIIMAENIRKEIEDNVRKLMPGGDFYMIDYGAFLHRI